MSKTLISSVLTAIENDSETASGQLIREGMRLDKMLNDLQNLRPVVDDNRDAVRTTTIHGLYLNTFLDKVEREMLLVSGGLAAAYSMAIGVTGTILDAAIYTLIVNYQKMIKNLEEVSGHAKGKLDQAASYIYEHSNAGGLEGLFWKGMEGLLFPVLGPEPETMYEYQNLEDSKKKAESLDLEGFDMTMSNLERIRNMFKDDPNMSRFETTKDRIKELEGMLVKNPKKTLSDFWTNAITQTEGWLELTGGG